MRVPFGGVTLPPLRRRLDVRRLVLGDLPMKAAALAVALVLWIAAISSAPPPEVTVQFDGRVPVERPVVPEGYVVRGQLGDIGVRLRGPGPALAALGQQHLRATLDLSAVVPGPEAQEVPVRVAVADERVLVVEVSPATVAVRLERRTERILAVQARFANEPPAGFQAGAATFRPQEVSLSGPESLVATVAAVLATLRFGDAPVDLAQGVQPVAVDAAGERVEGVQVDPVSVQVSAPVLSTATTRTVPVLWQLRGTVASGYWISHVATDPLVVTVSGARAVVSDLERIETSPVDVSGLSGGRTFVASLQLPPGSTLLGSAEARVTVTVVALVGTRPFPLVAVEPTGLGSGLAAEVDPETVHVLLSGTVPVLSGLAATAVTATVDVTGRGPGSHVTDVVVRAPPGTSLQTVQPTRVTVTIRQAKQ